MKNRMRREELKANFILGLEIAYWFSLLMSALVVIFAGTYLYKELSKNEIPDQDILIAKFLLLYFLFMLAFLLSVSFSMPVCKKITVILGICIGALAVTSFFSFNKEISQSGNSFIPIFIWTFFSYILVLAKRNNISGMKDNLSG